VLRVLVRRGDKVEGRTEVGPLAAELTDPAAVVWVDAEGESPDALAALRAPFGLHPVTVEDFVNRNQRPKVEEFEGYLFLVVHAVLGARDGDLETEELHLVLRHHALLTVHQRPLEAVERLRGRLLADPRSLTNGASGLAYHLSDAVVDGYYPILDALEDQIDAAEDAVVEAPTRAVMESIFRLKQMLVQLRKILGPQREVYNGLSRRDHAFIDPHVAVYFRDVHDHLVRAFDLLDSQRDLVSNALEAYLATVSNRLGQIMKQLTVIATIFMPLTFLTGFFGMNFRSIPFDGPWLLGAVILASVGLPIVMLWLFVRRGWILEDRQGWPPAARGGDRRPRLP
jgi:magnesium transporter